MRLAVRLFRETVTFPEPVIGEQPISEAYLVLDGLIRRHLPPTVASLLARPHRQAGFQEWYSDLAGQPIPAKELPVNSLERVQRVLRDRLYALNTLADQLEQRTQRTEAALLRSAARTPEVDDLFAVGGQPVMINWHRQRNPGLPTAAGAGRAPLSQPGSAVADQGMPPAAPARITGRRKAWWWLLPLLALFLLLVLLATLHGCERLGMAPVWSPRPPATPAMPADGPPPTLPLQDPSGGAGPPPRDLDAEIQRLEQELRDRLQSCPVEPQLAPAPASEIPAAPGQRTPDPAAAPGRPPAPAPVGGTAHLSPGDGSPSVTGADAPSGSATSQPDRFGGAPMTTAPSLSAAADGAPNSQAGRSQPQLERCPPAPPVWEAPEVVIALDASGSMRIPMSVATDQLRGLIDGASAGNPGAQIQLARLMDAPYGASRLAAAQEAIARTIFALPHTVSAGLVTFGDCKGAENFRFFGGQERARLIAVVRDVRPQQGTPLARGIERAAAMMDGRDVPGILVVISDGMDSCGGDPCAVARRLKAEKPNLKINYIDANGTGEARCIADATGGQVLPVRDRNSFEELLQQAFEQPLVPEDCREG